MAKSSPRALPSFVLAFCVCTANLAVAAVPSDSLMSSATRGFASVADINGVQDRFAQTQLGQLVEDESMRPFIEDLKRQIERKMSGIRDNLGLTIEDLRDIAAGEVGAGLIEREKGRAAVAVTVDVTGRVEAARELLAKVDADLTNRKSKRSAATSGGVEMTIYNIPPQAKNDIAREAVFFIHQDMLVATDSRVEAEEMIARFGGQPGNRLADVKGYQETLSRCTAEAGQLAPDVRWFVDPFGYARATRSLLRDTPGKKRGKDYVNVFESQGFDAIQALGGFVNLSVGDSFEMIHRTSVFAPPLPGEPEKYKLAMRMMEFPNGNSLQPQKWIPRKLASYRTFNCDLTNAYKHFGTLFDAMAGYENAFRDVIEGLEKDPYGPQVKVGEEFVSQLGQRVSLVTDYEVPITTKSERFMFMVELKDEKAVAAAVEKFMKADPNAHQREFQGKVVWEIMPAQQDVPELDLELDPLAPPASETGAGANAGPFGGTAMSNSAVCVTDNYLFVASHLDFLQRVLADKAEAEQLGNAGDFNEVQLAMDQIIQGPVAARCFRRNDEAYRPTYELLRQGKMPESETLFGRLLNRLLTSPEDEEEGILRKQNIDGRQLPDFEMVRRYFSPAGVVVRSLDDGWLIVGATLTKQTPQARAGAGAPRAAARVR